MIYEMYAIYDKKAGLFGTPIYQVNLETAKRYFHYLCSKQTEIDPLDLDLYYLGKFNSTTGEILPVKPDFVCGGIVKE